MQGKVIHRANREAEQGLAASLGTARTAAWTGPPQRSRRWGAEAGLQRPRLHFQVFIQNISFKNYLDCRSRLFTISTCSICMLSKERVKTLNVWLIYTLKIILKIYSAQNRILRLHYSALIILQSWTLFTTSP